MPKPTESPGTFLTHMLEKYKLNPFKLSKDIKLSQSAVRLIVLDKNRISVPVALRLAAYFNTNPEFWLAMQMKWDLDQAAKDKSLMNIVKGISKFKRMSAAGKQTSAKKPAAKKPAAKKPAAKKPAVKKAAVKAGKKPAAAKAKKAGGRGRSAKK